ncbi:MAG: small ribosomal subunit biogenesis GTPase RsgA [Kovacikia sp.]
MGDELQDVKAHDLSGSFTGTVLAIQANYYHVQLDGKWKAGDKRQQAEGEEDGRIGAWGDGETSTPSSNFKPHPPSCRSETLLCTRRSRLKKLGQKVMVGDLVEIEEPDWAGGRGAISQIFPRKSELDRPPVANAEQILLVFALAEPSLDPYQLSRFLVKAESTQLEVCLCLNKSDLIAPDEQDRWYERLQQWGYRPRLISVQQTAGLVELGDQLSQKVTIVCGPSGVGKSSLINRLIPSASLRVGTVSGKLARGRHTTRHVELFELPDGGFLADTPGFNQPDLVSTPEQLATYFPEIQQRLSVATCQFNDCLHRDEPICAVRGDWERYEHYLYFLDEAIAHQQMRAKMGDDESNLKLMTKEKGRQQHEPKLETKRYRRPSRRTQQQELQSLSQDFEESSFDGE